MYFQWPSDTKRVTDTFRWRIHPVTGEKNYHPGIDIAEGGYHPIYAVADGKVVDTYKDASYGTHLVLEHRIKGQVYQSLYAHMKESKVQLGDTVKQGDTIGVMGNTGRSTGQHLHFELHKGPWVSGRPNAVDPQDYLWQGYLKKGMKGPNVEDLQASLKDLGFYNGRIDGDYGPNTELAVKKFQQDRNLKADGIFGPNSLDALLPDGDYGIWLRNQSLKEVKIIQRMVHVDDDGYYGTQTMNAVKQFQSRYPELENDGIYGKNTKGKMKTPS